MKLTSALAITLTIVLLPTVYMVVLLSHRAAQVSNRPDTRYFPYRLPRRLDPLEVEASALGDGAALAERAGDLVLAEKLMRERMSLNRYHAWGDGGNLWLATIHEKQGREEEVYKDYRRYFNPPKEMRGPSQYYFDEYDDDASLLAKYGDLCLLHGDEREARRVYAAASRLCGTEFFPYREQAEFMTPPGADAPLKVLRAYALSASAERRVSWYAPAQGLHDIKVAVSLTPSDPFTRFYYGLILMREGQWALGTAEREWAYRRAHGRLKAVIDYSIETERDPSTDTTYPPEVVAATVPHPIDPLAARMP